MITIKELKEKLDRFRGSTGYTFDVVVNEDGEVTLKTFMKVKDSKAPITDDTILTCLED